MIENYYIECECYSLNHTVRIEIDPDDHEDSSVVLNFFLNDSEPWYKRIYHGLLYILGIRRRSGDYDGVILGKKNALKLASLIRKRFADDIVNDRIDKWHSIEESVHHAGLSTRLGLTRKEYAAFIEGKLTNEEIINRSL